MSEPEVDAFIECWNDGLFFEAHEVLEGLWMRTRDEFQRGLIQLAAALYHIQRDNIKGARTIFDRALPRLNQQPKHPTPIEAKALIDFASRVRKELSDSNGADLIDSRQRL